MNTPLLGTPHVTQVARGIEHNGIGAPAPGGLCHQAWQVFDSLTRDGVVPSAKECVEAGEAKGLNKGNLRTEYSRWKRFNGFAIADRSTAGTTDAVRELLRKKSDITAAEAVAALPDHNPDTVRTQVSRQRPLVKAEQSAVPAASGDSDKAMLNDAIVAIAKLLTHNVITVEQMTRAVAAVTGR